ncbi:cell division protein ZapA [uncultured Bacteroides sp.]|uniref:cell division protein ZapA n=1 Tax=uncultured Bacteroides sp. TaxID=162156 RepID=UPI002633482F|nr:cell division protein ZapA [uncultured Bacteroides sp.]
MNDNIKIHLLMAGTSYPLSIRREDEEMVREAARQVNVRLKQYRDYYPEASNEQQLGMVAYQFALETLRMEQRNDTAPYTAKLKELTEVIETCFKETEMQKNPPDVISGPQT